MKQGSEVRVKAPGRKASVGPDGSGRERLDRASAVPGAHLTSRTPGPATRPASLESGEIDEGAADRAARGGGLPSFEPALTHSPSRRSRRSGRAAELLEI